MITSDHDDKEKKIFIYLCDIKTVLFKCMHKMKPYNSKSCLHIIFSRNLKVYQVSEIERYGMYVFYGIVAVFALEMRSRAHICHFTQSQ